MRLVRISRLPDAIAWLAIGVAVAVDGSYLPISDYRAIYPELWPLDANGNPVLMIGTLDGHFYIDFRELHRLEDAGLPIPEAYLALERGVLVDDRAVWEAQVEQFRAPDRDPLELPAKEPPVAEPAASAVEASSPKSRKKWDPLIALALKLEQDEKLDSLSNEPLAVLAINKAMKRDAKAKKADKRLPYGIKSLKPYRPDGRPQPHLVALLKTARKIARPTREGAA